MSNKLGEWREEMNLMREKCAKAEGFARRMGLNEEDFTACSGMLDWCVFGFEIKFQDGEVNSIPYFQRMVAKVSLLLGPPNKVEEVSSSWATVPSLHATWCLEGIEVLVRVISPKGCKIMPGTEHVVDTRVLPKLHPECAHALSEIEDSV